MTWWERWGFNACHAVVATTGAAYGYMKYVLTTDDPFALVNHPWQPATLWAHLVAAPIFVAFFGMLFRSHTVRQLMSPNRVNRRSGWTSLIGFSVMAMSGYLVQVVTAPWLLTTMTWVHIGSGTIFVVGYGLHLAIGWSLFRWGFAPSPTRPLRGGPMLPHSAAAGRPEGRPPS